jgi:hypothetical protein
LARIAASLALTLATSAVCFLSNARIVSLSLCCSARKELIDIMLNEFRSRASEGKIRAAGICFGVRIVPLGQVEKANAIQVALEREDGDAVDIFVPYEQLSDGEFTSGELFACERIPKLFVLQHQQN